MPMREVEVSYDGDFRGIFTKCLPQPQFEYLRKKKLMGW